ncbi:phosphohistidine phosphatase SixA [Vibrio rhodolitus]|uniref:phosphohistidine phosphatase SixA n=1 Tax=Vibrio rhodolitus TaxID=2231649 RepID=UPI000E0AEFA3|nr:phosphohistidine phosphatase SixA [Vibrio rhodolitus]
MKIVIMRHGEAETFAQSDAERALTKFGRSASRDVAQRCTQEGIAQFDKVLVSPYKRAQQTWQELEEIFDAKDVQLCEEITPYGDSESVVDYLQAIIDVEQLESVLLVSHLPLVGYLTADLVVDMAPPMFPTSGMVCVEYNVEKQQGELVWSLKP